MNTRSIRYLDPSISRFNPKLLYWVFIPSDIISLALQAAGGGMSSLASGQSKEGVNIALGGLSLQVFTLLVFTSLALDYAIRYYRQPCRAKLNTRFKIFLGFFAAAILLILGRCMYRIDELSDGFTGPLFHNENLFYAFESS